MKKFVFRSLTVSVLSLAGSAAFAQTNTNNVDAKEQKVAIDSSATSGGTLFSQDQIDALKKEMEKKDVTENKITVGGLIQLNANTSDSQRSSSPDFAAQKIRLGVNVSGGIASGQIELQFVGNQQSTQTTSNSITSGDQGNGQVTIRRAQLNLDVLTLKGGQNTYTTTLSLGGIRMGGADGTAPDTAWTTNGFGRQDGAYLKETLEFGKAAKIELGAGAFNNINTFTVPTYLQSANNNSGFTGWKSSSSAIQANWGNTSFSQSVGFAGHLTANVNIDDDQSVTVKALYGTQGNAPSAQKSDGTLDSARDVSHTEASLVYNHGGIFGSKGVDSGNGIAVWYENDVAGRKKSAASNNSGDFNYTTGTDDSQNTTLIGVSVAADSANYLTGMLQKGDRLTYALAYATFNAQFGSATTSPNYTASQISAAIGYAVNTFEIQFNYDIDSSDTNIFADSKGVVNKKDAQKSYFTALYAF
ncbi:hypothetical protein [Silvanigrella aquatica]|uniref:Porin domain-containing protein n=1 Tax=Silvanigrella aquatica TaxID=1915309 RepID=A0A1L4D1F7_9BACT|nr:hypothetical protein [Silvanigrella aquatica]APJ04026.1 hypothetical protein AXG55_08940 [Silvanigrella aquatica]